MYIKFILELEGKEIKNESFWCGTLKGAKKKAFIKDCFFKFKRANLKKIEATEYKIYLQQGSKIN